MVSLMDRTVLKRAEEVLPYVHEVRRLADDHRYEFGFLPESAYIGAAAKGNLWIVVDKVSRELCGYLYFGGQYPRLRVFQVCVHPDYRSSGTAQKLVSELIQYGTECGYLNVNARVSSKLEANKFWQRIGFYIVKQIPGKGPDTTINLYATELDVPSLFGDMNCNLSTIVPTMLQIDPRRPVLSTPSYVIDLNVLFDAIRDRDTGQCAQILSAALRHEIRLSVTPEFAKELARSSGDRGPDPVLAFARELPVLSRTKPERLRRIIAEVRELLASSPPGPRRWTVNDESDHIHLASSIDHQAFGFITRDAAILRSSAMIHDRYGLHVVSPHEVVDKFGDDDQRSQTPTLIASSSQEIETSDINEGNRKTVEQFLDRRAADTRDIQSSLTPDPTQPHPESLVVATADQIAGVGLWSGAPGAGRDALLHVYVDEFHREANLAIDGILDWAPRTVEPRQSWLLSVNIPRDQVRTTETALRRGFQTRAGRSGRANIELSRMVIREPISADGWRRFRRDLMDTTGLALPTPMPTHEEMRNTGIVLGRGSDVPFTMTLFDFESFISPGYLIGPGRSAVIVPIRKRYSDELLPQTRSEGVLWQSESSLRLERVYYLRAGMHGLFPRGTIIVFYASGDRGQAVALGRVTFSETITKTQAATNLTRQGVLTQDEIGQRANDRNEITVFTFDNVLEFPVSIDFKKLKRMGCVGRLNLRTAQRLPAEALVRVVKEAFGGAV